MFLKIQQGESLPFAALFTWLAVSGLAIYLTAQRDIAPLHWITLLTLLNFAGMCLAMEDTPHRISWQWGGLALHLISALMICWLVPISFMPIYTVVWISMVASLLSQRMSLLAL